MASHFLMRERSKRGVAAVPLLSGVLLYAFDCLFIELLS